MADFQALFAVWVILFMPGEKEVCFIELVSGYSTFISVMIIHVNILLVLALKKLRQISI
jgi:hypothetical protein